MASARAVRAVAMVAVALFYASLVGVSLHESFDVKSGAAGASSDLGSAGGAVEGSTIEDSGSSTDAAATDNGSSGTVPRVGSTTGKSAGSTGAGSTAASTARSSAGTKASLPPLVVGDP